MYQADITMSHMNKILLMLFAIDELLNKE